MKVDNLLKEKHYSGPLYHSTTWRGGEGIMRSGMFKLSNAGNNVDDRERQLLNRQDRKYKYYLSLSRDKQNIFRQQDEFKVTFVLDGSYYNSRYHLLPVDYSSVNPIVRKREESEERLWHTENSIPAKNIVECHIYIELDSTYIEPDEAESAIYIEKKCREKGIKTYYYAEWKPFVQLNKKRSGTLQPYTLDHDGEYGHRYAKVDYKRADHISESIYINEKHYTGPLYHITRPDSAYSILKTGMFKAADKEGTIAQELGNWQKGYEYFISVGREKTADYRVSATRHIKPVTFILDSNYYNKSGDYLIKPIDYWGFQYLGRDIEAEEDNIPRRARGASEAEERIWTKERNFPAKILEVHIYMVYDYEEYGHDEYKEYRLKEVWSIAQQADNHGIPHYVYDTASAGNDEAAFKAYLLLNKRKSRNILEH